jgi:predicted nucleotidyltransferase
VIDTRAVTRKLPASAASDIEAAVGILSRDPGVRRIWLFGSVAKGRQPDFRSDVDLAVEGLAAERYLSVWAALDEGLRLSPDLVRWEEANATLRDQIERWGILLYERT